MKIRQLKVDFHGGIPAVIERPQLLARIRCALKRSRVGALIGPRHSGKTTLAGEIVPAGSINYFDLENPASLARLEQPLTALEDLEEVQQVADACIVVVRVLNERRWLEHEDYQWKEEEECRRQVEEEKQIRKEKEDHKKVKLVSVRKTQLDVSEGPLFLASADPFEFLKNRGLKHELEWVGIGGVRSITILRFQNLTGIAF